jgi:SAM-dependent MidA family methyltransferase
MTNIRGILMEEVARRGAISFARFMELALYCPDFGYYERIGASPGRKGDYFTSVSAGSLFGQLLAFQFAGWLEPLPTNHRQIIEAGAHDGQLAVDILQWFQAHRPDLANSIAYSIMEPSARRRQSQQKSLGDAGLVVPVKWFGSWNALPPAGVSGVVFSNELLDAMPVHRLGWDAKQRQWFEWGVTVHKDDFVWTRLPGDPALIMDTHLTLPRELLDVLPDGFTTEVCPAAVDWWRQAARILQVGKLVAFDYGLTAEEFFTPERKDGTLRAYYRHHLTGDLLARPGEQDLTAHVDFSAIRDAGEAEGLRTEEFGAQGRYLTGIVERMCASDPAFEPWISTRSRQFQTLTHPEHLGRTFRVLVQGR